MALEPELIDHDHILDFVQLCRDEHVAPCPVATRIISEHTGLSIYRVRLGVEQLLDDGRLAKMAAYPDHGVVLP
jgi:FaeA-like protein